jgi:hypothetical protein
MLDFLYILFTEFIGGVIGLLLFWLIGGTASLWLGCRFILKGTSVTLWKSFLIVLITGTCFLLLFCIPVIGWVLPFCVGWWLTRRYQGLSGGKAALAVLMTTPAIFMCMGVFVTTLIASAHERNSRAFCGMDLERVLTRPESYRFPADGRAATQPKDVFENDLLRERYFFLPLREGEANRIIACDLAGNHYDGRNVLESNGTVRWLSEQAFQDEIAGSRYAEFRLGLSMMKAAKTVDYSR